MAESPRSATSDMLARDALDDDIERVWTGYASGTPKSQITARIPICRSTNLSLN